VEPDRERGRPPASHRPGAPLSRGYDSAIDPDSKIDPQTKRLLEQDAASAPETVSVFLRGRGAFGDEELSRLREQGAEIRTVADDVLTALVPLSKLADVAAQDFVVRVEGSSPLYAEGAGGTPPAPDVE
jgi:hypothetical protein